MPICNTPYAFFSGTAVEQFFSYSENATNNAYFWLNNFKSMTASGVTLFELTGKQMTM